MELFTRVVDHFDMNDASTMMLAVNLWKLAQVQGAADTKKMVRAVLSLFALITYKLLDI